MTQVGLEALTGQLRDHLRQARNGEQDRRGRPVAALIRIDKRQKLRRTWDLVDTGRASWNGGKPKGSARPVKVRAKNLSDGVLEDRR